MPFFFRFGRVTVTVASSPKRPVVHRHFREDTHDSHGHSENNSFDLLVRTSLVFKSVCDNRCFIMVIKGWLKKNDLRLKGILLSKSVRTKTINLAHLASLPIEFLMFDENA